MKLKTSLIESHVTGLSQAHQEEVAWLSSIHGNIRVARESSGIHAYLACPECLEKDGVKELTSMHLALNLDKYLQNTDGRGDFCACCMKTALAYRMSTLKKMLPLAERGIQMSGPTKVYEKDNSQILEDDGRGNMVPKGPGLTQAVISLPGGHPARVYLDERGYDIPTLTRMFRIGWCSKEREDVFYRTLKGGFKATPQNRIIFYIDMFGVQQGWQARILDGTRKKAKYCYHPYTSSWEVVQTRYAEDREWEEVFEPLATRFDPAKYIIGAGCKRNQTLMGFDAAVEFNKNNAVRYAVITEGPLDVGKCGSPGMATMGKYFSDEQAKLLADNFERVIYVGDNDTAGKEVGRPRFVSKMSKHPHVRVQIAELPPEYKDLGELSIDNAKQFVADTLKS